jgi:hypothetical protein
VSASVLFLLVAGAAGIGLVRTIRGQARDRRYLASEDDDAPLQVSHLSRPLQGLARETRALRLSFDGPLRDLEAAVGPIVETEEIDVKLTSASRDLGDWIKLVDRLGHADQELLVDLGIQTSKIRTLFEEADWNLDRRTLGARKLAEKIRSIARELGHIEEVLQRQHDPYR